MPHCKSCAAPLPAYTSICEYCGAKNDVDLRGVSEFTVSQESSDRFCPMCNRSMETISLKGIKEFTIERCPSCLGFFFDPEELNAVLDKSVNQVYSIDMNKIQAMNQMKNRPARRSRAYIKCPVCGDLMNRINFGARSGVVVDQCKHGIWLDGGALRKLLEWRKAGGRLYHEKIMGERAEREEKEREEKELKRLTKDFTIRSSPLSGSDADAIDLSPLLESAAKAVWRLFT
ncbi:MAG: zf-TFIIB domain-containing protein [Chitinispirillaceae bacterium]|nr:zf-TFIIB domain-containing protein [Chitinispirillaceae bacterium]